MHRAEEQRTVGYAPFLGILGQSVPTKSMCMDFSFSINLFSVLNAGSCSLYYIDFHNLSMLSKMGGTRREVVGCQISMSLGMCK